nr:protein kinase [Luteimonas salinisoli]
MALAPELHAVVARLLAAHGRHRGPLDGAPLGAGLAGRRIGDWTLEEVIGRGGMAVVYRASRGEGAQRQVAALKLLTLGAMVSGGVRRFRREQAILARLRHPHIAQLLEAGVLEDGTPWLAMSLVDGEPIDLWCRAHGLDLRERVRLLFDVCSAVAHAHRNLIIHRDIKPSNVLVDGDGHVRLLDFGIAHLLEAADGTPTGTQAMVLTPQFAAPEQFLRAPASTAMDVYGLGALLYHLVVGRPPRPSGLPDEPVTAPSRVLIAATAAGTDGTGFRRGLRGDLDAIVLKALDPDPERRYASPGDLASDLSAWLDRRPVQARAAGPGYRLRCFARRHRVAVAANVALLLSLGGGVAATLWQAAEARREAARATAAKDFLVDLLQSPDPASRGGRIVDTAQVLRLGATRVREQFAAQPALRTELLQVIGRAQWHLGDLESAEAALDAALQSAVDREQRGISHLILGEIHQQQGRFDDSLAQQQAAIAELTGLRSAQARRSLVYAHLYRGQVTAHLGDATAALPMFDLAEALEAALPQRDPRRRMHLLVHRGQSLLALHRPGEALEVLEDALALVPEPGIADLPLLTTLAQANARLDRPALAETYYRRVVDTMRAAYPPDNPALATPLNNLGSHIADRGRGREAEPLLREALELRRRAGGEGEGGGRLAPALTNYAVLLAALGRENEAVPMLEEASAAADAAFGPVDFRSLMVRSYLAQVHGQRGDAPATDAVAGELQARILELGEMSGWPPALAGTLRRLALAQLLLGRTDDALAELDRLDLLARATGRPLSAPDLAQSLALRLYALALQERRDGAGTARLARELAQLGEEHRFARATAVLALGSQRQPGDPDAAPERMLAEVAQSFPEGELPAHYRLMVSRLASVRR